MKHQLTELTRYNVWANARIMDALRTLPPEVIDAPVKGSFTSIRKTIYHIWDAQVIWLNRLQGISLNMWPSTEYDDNFAGFDVYFIRQSEDFVRFVETRTDSYFETLCYYKTLEGKEYQTRVWEIVMHVMNHSTYHRGQIIHMFRSLDIHDPVSTDFILYSRGKESGF
ncbi:MAG: DinB family protein [Chitinophagales bacterium]